MSGEDVVRVAVQVLASWDRASGKSVLRAGQVGDQRAEHRRTFAGQECRPDVRVDALVKKIGFLSFGHWSSSPGSHTRSASEALLQSIDLAVAAEELGADGAYFRVHHFARQLGSPFPLLAAIGARTRRLRSGRP
jgi:hypothetical protein